MKEYLKLPEDLKKEKEEGSVLEENLIDDGIRDGHFFPDRKQGSSFVKIRSGYIVSWFLGDEEWYHVYDENEKNEAYQDFISIIMEESMDVVEETKEDALDFLEEIGSSEPQVMVEALKPILFALNQDNEKIQCQAVDVLITLANRNLDLIKLILPKIKNYFVKEKNSKVGRRLVYLLSVVGEKNPHLVKDLENIFMANLDSNDIAMITTILSFYNKIGRKDISFIEYALPKIKDLTKSKNISVKTLANNILRNFNF